MHKVYIRADAGTSIGLGHVIRCIALAQMLKNDFDICFFCLAVPDKIATALAEENFKLKYITAESDFLNMLQAKDIVVLDGYGFDTGYQKKIKDAGASLVCIDDLHDKEFYADLIINHAPGVSKNDYKVQDYTEFALGSSYALLRSPFLKAALLNRQVEKIDSVLICFGGADNKNLTNQALAATMNAAELKKINVVLGAAYLQEETLMELVSSDKRIELYRSLSDEEMLLVMQQSGAAIVPASGILFETLAAGCIAFSGYYVDNQQAIYNGFKALNAIVDLGNFENMDTAIAAKFSSSKTSTKKVIDGLSGTRLLDTFKSLAG